MEPMVLQGLRNMDYTQYLKYDDVPSIIHMEVFQLVVGVFTIIQLLDWNLPVHENQPANLGYPPWLGKASYIISDISTAAIYTSTCLMDGKWWPIGGWLLVVGCWWLRHVTF